MWRHFKKNSIPIYVFLPINARDDTEDVKALNKVFLIQPSLEITPKVTVDLVQAVNAKQTFEDMTFFDQNHARVKTFKQMSYPDG